MFKSILLLFYIIVITDLAFSNDKVSIPLQYLPNSLSPGLVNDTGAQFLLNNLADGLVGWSYEEGIHPEISNSWKELSEGEIKFVIRKDLKNYKGMPVSCENILKILQKNFHEDGPFQSLYKKIKKMSCLDNELIIKSKMNSKSLLGFLASSQGKVLLAKKLEVIDGIGPYKLYINKNDIKFFKNPFYYDKNKIFIEQVNFTILNDDESLKYFLNDKVDMVLLSNLNGKNLGDVKSENITSLNLWTTWGIAFNQKIKPFDDKKLRHCLIQHTSSKDWISKFYPNDLPAFGPIPFGVIGYSNNIEFQFSNYRSNFKGMVNVFVPKELGNSESIGIWIKNNFGKCFVNPNVNIKIISFNEMMKLFEKRYMGSYLMSFSKENISDELFFQSFYTSGKENFYNNHSSTSRTVFEGLNKITELNSSNVSMNIANTLRDDAVMIPLMHPIHKVIIKNCIKGLRLNPISEGYFVFKNIRNTCK